MGWLALDRALRIADTHRLSTRQRRRWRDRTRRPRRRRDRDEASTRSKAATPAATARPTSTRPCSSCRSLGIEDADSPRVRGTIDAITAELGAGGPLLYRYPPGRDGLPGTEGAFLPCSFWLVQALACTGRASEATKRFEALLDHASPLGLYAEEIDPASGAHLGNFPQALTHAALVQAALALRDSARAAPRSGRSVPPGQDGAEKDAR